MEMVAVPASDRKVTQNTHQAPVLLTQTSGGPRFTFPCCVVPRHAAWLRQPTSMCLRSSFTTSSAFGRRRIYPDFASITSQNRSITESKRVNNRVCSGANRRQFRRNTSSSSIPMPFLALEEHFLPAVKSEIGRSVMVTTHDPVQAMVSTTAKVSPHHRSAQRRK